MVLSIGEILFDHFPDYRRAGGAPFNYSYHLKKLGLPVHFVTRVGDDPEGRELKDLLQKSGFDGRDVQTDPEHRSGKVKVGLDHKGDPVFDIVPDVAFDHLTVDGPVRSLLEKGPELVYYGTLIQRTPTGHRFVQDVLSAVEGSSRFLCDLNLRPGCYTRETVKWSVEGADVLKLNLAELRVVKDIYKKRHSDDDCCRWLMEEHGIELLALTMGDQGSVIHHQDGALAADPPDGATVADTVGAGDGYTSILTAGYIGGWRPEKILRLATAFASDICRIEGALPHTDPFYGKYRAMMEEDQIEG